MPLGYIILIIVGVLVVFGFAHRVLDRMGLSDKGALVVIIAILIGSFIPDIRLGGLLTINIGGAIIPLILCIYLIVKADTSKEKIRAIVASVITGVVVYIVSKILPNEPEAMLIEPTYIYSIVAGVVAYLFGRSRRSSFIAGIFGIMVNDFIQLIVNGVMGIPGAINMGGAGFLDTVLLSGIFAVLIAEVIGEFREKLQGGTSKKQLRYEGGGFTSSIGTTDNKVNEFKEQVQSNSENESAKKNDLKVIEGKGDGREKDK